MDAFDFVDAQEATRSRRRMGLVWNILTLLVLLSTLCIGLLGLTLFVNPNSAYNPFPPATLPPTLALPTATNTPRIQFEPTWTATLTSEPSATPTERPSATPMLTETASVPPTATLPPGPSGTPEPFAFVVQEGSPAAISGAGFHPTEGCNWMGVAGQATSLNDSPVLFIFVQLGGTLEGRIYEPGTTMTGSAPQYGQGGFEFTISDHVVASQGSLWIQLLDQAGLPLSDKVYFDTYDDCEKNLIIIYFKQVR